MSHTLSTKLNTQAYTIVKGCPRDHWDEVQAIQEQPFLYLITNGSKWGGEEPDDVDALLDRLATHPLDPIWEGDGSFHTVEPCIGVQNPQWTWGSDEERYLDGPRMYERTHAVRFFGNFFTYSHGFLIDTNVPAVIEALIEAIRNNQATAAYAEAKAQRKVKS